METPLQQINVKMRIRSGVVKMRIRVHGIRIRIRTLQERVKPPIGEIRKLKMSTAESSLSM
jgi:hypothetical protein